MLRGALETAASHFSLAAPGKAGEIAWEEIVRAIQSEAGRPAPARTSSLPPEWGGHRGPLPKSGDQRGPFPPESGGRGGLLPPQLGGRGGPRRHLPLYLTQDEAEALLLLCAGSSFSGGESEHPIFVKLGHLLCAFWREPGRLPAVPPGGESVRERLLRVLRALVSYIPGFTYRDMDRRATDHRELADPEAAVALPARLVENPTP
jgi:hypothetical protein